MKRKFLYVASVWLFFAAFSNAEDKQDNILNQFLNEFSNSYNNEVNAAHFKVVVVDAARLSFKLASYHRDKAKFPGSVEELQYTAFSEHIETQIELNEDGVFRMRLSELFGENKYITMRPLFLDGDVSDWECLSNIPAELMDETFCLPVDER